MYRDPNQEIKKLQSELDAVRKQAFTDGLTGLYNRRKFEEYLEEILLNVREEDRHHALLYLDLDNFKIVNDTCGHVAGDELLKQLPALLNEVLRSGDIVARLGGDEAWEHALLALGEQFQRFEAAGAVGFEDPFHFSRVFKKFKGISPSQVRV